MREYLSLNLQAYLLLTLCILSLACMAGDLCRFMGVIR